MELFSDDIKKIRALLDNWQKHPEIEVEATFGLHGKVDTQTFLRVVSRLRSKGYEAISQQDRLTISLKDGLRFTINGTGNIMQYCRTNSLDNIPFVALIKDRTLAESERVSATIDIPEYSVRIKGRRETELSSNDPIVKAAIESVNWGRSYKYFRLIRRWSFKTPGLIYDLSMVRSTQYKDGYARQRTFQEQNLFAVMPAYEIEVELDRSTLPENATQDYVLKKLINGLGDILRGIQNSQLLIRESTKADVLKQYNELTKLTRFRGVGPVTLQRANMTAEETEKPNIRSGYNVTDKADGLRVHAFTDKDGELFMIDMSMNVYKTGLVQHACRNALLDGEFVTKSKKDEQLQELLLFDMYYSEGEDISKKPFKDGRFVAMNDWFTKWLDGGVGPQKKLKTSNVNVGVKRFFFANKGDETIFECAANVLRQDEIRNYHTDGLIFTPNDLPLPQKAGVRFPEQFKWKPAEENTIDFLVVSVKEEDDKSRDKITLEIHPVTGENIFYKTFQLFVASEEDPAFKDPRGTILNMLPIPNEQQGIGRGKYKPVPFIPKEFSESMANVCFLKTVVDPSTQEEYVTTERSGEPIRDKSVVEMRYDGSQPPGWRWIPIRVRADKTERFLKGTIGGAINSDNTAQDNWISIQQPVTEHMITRNLEFPSEEEVASLKLVERPVSKKYYEKTASLNDQRKVEQLQEFHNKWIKDTILFATISKNSPNPSLLDVAAGRGGDIHRWRRIGAKFVLGVDATGECCLNTKDGAYARFLNILIKAQSDARPVPIPPMVFVIGDSSRRLVDGTAGENEEEGDMLRSVLGRVEPLGTVPPYIRENAAGALRQGANALTCMYALHYFFQSPDKLNGLLQNIADNLKIGGLFVGTNFDGQAVFDLLRNVNEGETVVGKENDTVIWEITKKYVAEELPQDDSGFGMAIDVRFISIGLTHTEYLVPWQLFVNKMRTVGCELLSPQELNALGLNNSTNMYEESYKMAAESPFKKRYEMNKGAREYSFLHRWYIFKRTSQGLGEIGKVLAPNAVVNAMEGVLEEGDAEEVEGAVEANASLAALSAAVQNSATQSQFMASMAPATGLAAATVLQAQILQAEQNGNMNALQQLNAQAVAIETTLQTVQGIAPSAPSSKQLPPGSVAKQFVTDYMGAQAFTVPVMPIAGAEVFENDKVVQFSEKSLKTLKHVKVPQPFADYAGRTLAPNAPFRIVDELDTGDKTQYPSITHYLSGMMFKYASNRPELAASVFGIEGKIHMDWLRARQEKAAKAASKKLTQDEQREFVLDETADVETLTQYWKKKDTKFNEASWAVQKDAFLRSAIAQRIRRDKAFCVVASAAISQGKYLLYYDETPGSEMGGTRQARTGKIQGSNKYGKLITQLVAEMPEEIKACLALPNPF